MSLTYLKISTTLFVLLINIIPILITVGVIKHLKKLNWQRKYNEIITRKLLDDIKKWNFYVDGWVMIVVFTIISSIPSGFITYFTFKNFV